MDNKSNTHGVKYWEISYYKTYLLLLVHIRQVVTEMVQSELSNKVKEIEEKIESHTFEIADIKIDHQQAITDTNDKFELLKTEIHKKSLENKELKEELLRLDTHNRKLNLKFSNIPDTNPARQMLVSFHHPKQRNTVLYSGSKIKRLCNVTVEEDYPEEIQLRRKMHLRSFKEARKTVRARLVDDTFNNGGWKKI